METTHISIAYGDGIGPEVMDAALYVLKEAGANLTIEAVELGARIYSQGGKSGVLPSAWERIARSGILLKGPILLPPDASIATDNALRDYFKLDGEHRAELLENAEPNAILTAHAYIGEQMAIFQPAHGAALKLAGKQSANPSAMILSSILMLQHIDQYDVAMRIKQAWKKTIAAGHHPADMETRGTKEILGTMAFAEMVAQHLCST